jgi:anti-sigma regulatory factor (Ser/Thr protein kinase)
VEIVLTNQPGERQRLVSALETFARDNDLAAPVRQAADLALEEHVTNVLRYAYGDAQSRPVLVRLELENGFLLVEVEDEGKPFDPLKRPDVDTSIPLEDKPVGGLGIYLIRKFMDEVKYRREGNKNILTMRKRLDGKPCPPHP